MSHEHLGATPYDPKTTEKISTFEAPKTLRPDLRHEPRSSSSRVRLGEWLVQRSLITRSNLFRALNTAYTHGGRLGDAVVEMGLLDRQTLEHEVTELSQTA